jgi:hypothetical protein
MRISIASWHDNRPNPRCSFVNPHIFDESDTSSTHLLEVTLSLSITCRIVSLQLCKKKIVLFLASLPSDNVYFRGYKRRMEILLISAGLGSEGRGSPESGLVEAQQRLRRMVLDTVASPNSRRNYGKALDDLFALSAGRPLTQRCSWSIGLRWKRSLPRPPMYGSRRCANWLPRLDRTRDNSQR